MLVSGTQSSLILTPSYSSSVPGTFCPGPVQFTCVGIATSVILEWTLEGVRIGTYIFHFEDEFPQDLSVMWTSLQIDSIQIVNASQVGLGINIVSTLSVSDVSILNGSSLQCQDGLGHESNAIVFNVIKGMDIIMISALCALGYMLFIAGHMTSDQSCHSESVQ